MYHSWDYIIMTQPQVLHKQANAKIATYTNKAKHKVSKGKKKYNKSRLSNPYLNPDPTKRIKAVKSANHIDFIPNSTMRLCHYNVLPGTVHEVRPNYIDAILIYIYQKPTVQLKPLNERCYYIQKASQK